MSRTRKIAAVALGVTVLLPAAAQGATRTVVAGPPQKVKGLPPGADSNAFYRKTVTVHVGDKVKWNFAGFHTVTFPAKGKKPPAFIGPDPSGALVSGLNDAAGNPFWFNGKVPKLALTATGGLPQGGKTYNGKKLVSSGAPLSPGAPKPYTVKFTKKGTYTYYCTIHPGQKAKVKVVGKKKAIPSNKANAKAAKKEYAKVVKQLKKDGKFVPAGNVVYAGKDTVNSTVLGFFPTTKSVPVGTTVTFTMSPKSTEAHTITFGPADYLKPLADGFIGPDPANPKGLPVVNAQDAFPSDPPPAFPAVDGSNHGNGFFNTGILDQDATTPTNPEAAQVTFNKAGTYSFICLIHPDMQGSIVVG